MHRFAFANVRTIAEAAGAASTTVADAMTIAPEAMVRDEMSVVKAGGIDILDLLKEGLLAPDRVVNLKEVPGLDTVIEEQNGGVRIGPMITLAALADHPLLRTRRRLAGCGQSANPQRRDLRRQPAAAPPLLVFPLARLSLLAQRRRPLLRNCG
jgi:xanthine dehydrogenase YagS FAD-binding subunit